MSTYEVLAHLLAEKHGVDPDAIKPDASIGDLGLDSLRVIEVLFDAEDQLGIEIPQEKMAFETLGDAATMLDELLAERSG